MVSPAMLKGMNTEIYGEGHPFGDPSWYQAYNTPYYNDTHKQFRKLMREYVDEHIMSNVHDWDEKGTIPKEMYLEAGKQGTLALCIGRPWPEKYFGPSPWGFEPDYFHELIMYDEMSRTGSVGFQWGVAGGTTIGLPPVYHHGSEELKNRVMPPCVKGEKVCCLAITEPTAGSDVANLKCTAKLEGDYYILNGEKKWITNGIFADYFTVACRTGKPGVGGISLLLVEKGMEGLETRKMKCSGAWSSGTTYITFDDVKVPKGNLLGKEGKGFQYMTKRHHQPLKPCFCGKVAPSMPHLLWVCPALQPDRRTMVQTAPTNTCEERLLTRPIPPDPRPFFPTQTPPPVPSSLTSALQTHLQLHWLSHNPITLATDGGAHNGIAAWAIAWDKHVFADLIQGEDQTPYAAEVVALTTLYQALATAAETLSPQPALTCIIAVDCTSAIHLAHQDYPPDQYFQFYNSIQRSQQRLRHQGLQVYLEWTPSHDKRPDWSPRRGNPTLLRQLNAQADAAATRCLQPTLYRLAPWLLQHARATAWAQTTLQWAQHVARRFDAFLAPTS